MNGNALKLRRAVEKHDIIGLDTAPFIYYIKDVCSLDFRCFDKFSTSFGSLDEIEDRF